MDKKQREQAIALFSKKFGKTPQECGFPVVDIFEKQKVYIYAPDKDLAEAYKSLQCVIRWILMWSWWPLLLAVFIFFFYGMPKYAQTGNLLDPITVLTAIFLVVWIILVGLHCHWGYTLGKKCGKSVCYINYR